MEGEEQQKGNYKNIHEALKVSQEENEKMQIQLKTAMDRVAMLEHGLELKTTSTQRIVKDGQDSMEIGAQATGRVKVYGDFVKKAEFAAKIKDALELMEATRGQLEKMNGEGKGAE